MRQYERSGVTVDQCTECRGIFLDRGELEKLFEAEANWNQRQPTPPGSVPPPPPQAPQGGGYAPPPPPPGHHQPGYPAPQPVAHGYPPAPQYGGHGQQQHGYHGHYRKKKRKGGFLGEMFD